MFDRLMSSCRAGYRYCVSSVVTWDNASHDWVDAAHGYFVLSNAIQGSQEGLIDMYYNKNSGEWMISMDGHGHYCGLCLSGEDGTSRAPCCPCARRSH